MSSKPGYINAKRRGFLQGTAVAGTAVAVGTATASDLPAPAVDATDIKPRHAGYRVTDKVREYYAKARF